ncbi:unnamed protein product [Caenorhabditis angaria]|uniref:G-protein coupled receptors family 1 profile domain-containing protein n=1 Tax=Caenorhabditis angaria TaxID=860376 RepID=A0A9P1MZY4_9PELO|nr:unnamed protein product [Caenorhabditis angaria]
MRNNSTDSFYVVDKCDDNEIESIEMVEQIFGFINAVMPIMAILALIINLNFLVAVIYGVRRGRLPLKRYVMTINRSLADMMTICIAGTRYITEYFTRCNNAHYCAPIDNTWFSNLMQTTFILNYWSVSLSYTGIAFLTYYAVRSPLQYKVRLTSSKVIRIILFSWLSMIFLLFTSVFLFQDGKLNYNGNSVIHLFFDDFSKNDHIGIWLVDLCVQIENHSSYKSAMVTMIPPLIFYIISIGCYCLISQELFYRRTTNIYKRHRSAVWRLGTHLLLFSVACFLTATAYYGSIPISNFCDPNSKDEERYLCMGPVVSYTMYTAAAVIGWFARMTVDGFIDTYVDGVLRQSFFQAFRPVQSNFTVTTADTRHPLEISTHKVSTTSNMIPMAHVKREFL